VDVFKVTLKEKTSDALGVRENETGEVSEGSW